MARMSNKLTGRDFPTCSSMSTASVQLAVDHSTLIAGDSREVDHGLSVKVQVEKLIGQATSHENLCQNYVGYVKVHSSFSCLSSSSYYIYPSTASVSVKNQCTNIFYITSPSCNGWSVCMFKSYYCHNYLSSVLTSNCNCCSSCRWCPFW